MRVPIILAALLPSALPAQKPFTIEQALSAPYATGLSAAPVGDAFVWLENAEGRRNLYLGGPGTSPRMLTHNLADDAISAEEVVWSPDASMIAYVSEPATDDPPADGKPANPAHLQHPVKIEVVVQPLAPDAAPIDLGEGTQPLFSRDSKSVYFVRAGQIWIDTLPATTPSQLVFDRGNATSLTLSPDGNTLAFISRRREPNQPPHSYLALFDLRAHTLTFPAPSTGNDTAPSFSPDGAQIAWLRSPFERAPEFAPDRVSPNPWSIQLLDLPAHTSTNLSSTPINLSSRPEPASFAGAVERPAALPATTVLHTLFTPAPNQPGSVLPHLASGQPRVLFVTSRRLIFFSESDGWIHLYALDPHSSAAPTLLTPGDYEVEDATLSRDHKALLYASNDDTAAGHPDPLDRDRRHLWRLDLTAATPLPTPLTHGAGIETQPALSSTGTLAALVADAHVPMHPALIDATGGITALNPATLPADYPGAHFVTPQQVLFTAADGLHLHGQLFLPPNLDPAKKHAALIFFHGGPRRQMLLGYPAMGYYSNAYANNQFLAAQGYIVLSVNYRCGVGYGLNFRQCLHGGGAGAAEYNDALAAQKYLANRPDVDPHRIGVWGGSYGGYFTALALARNSNLFAAGVDFHGVHDWNLEDNAADWLHGTYAERDATAALALASSPLADIAHWHAPVLFIHGDDDGNVAYAQTPILADRLRARNASLPPAQQVRVEELIFPDEIHAFLLHSSWLKAYEAESAFFAGQLKP